MTSGIDQPFPNAAPSSSPSGRIRLAGKILRALFIVVLIVITARVAAPQNERFWSIYETPGDLIRLGVGVCACFWLAANLFVAPKDKGAYRTWFYLGLALLPLAVTTTVVVW
jgi:hypothetical protein